MRKIQPPEWRPADGMHLEPNALRVVGAEGNTLVVAGPGSGKTELLAQKACYLLQTQLCKVPKRILAISFKVDAAFNLKDRVHKRCGGELSKRFDSFTFDAFAKRILDRFHLGLPEPYKVGAYDINVRMGNDIEAAFKAVDINFYNTVNVGGTYERFLVSRPVPVAGDDPTTNVLRGVWQYLLRRQPPDLNFSMVMRLAALIISTNPLVKRYLQLTYSHVFLDEFQDTTFAQYDLLNSCFADSGLNFTAVGDEKQTIMGWAGARPGIFTEYCRAYHATEIPLTMNWRSAPRLIEFQNHLVRELLRKPAVAVPADGWDQNAGEVRMCFFPDQAAEMEYLLDQLQQWLGPQELCPRDICILVKQQPDQYASSLINYLRENGIVARDETELQELLVEPIPVFMVNLMEVVFGGKYGQFFDEVFNLIRFVHQSYDDQQMVRLNRRVLRFVRELRAEYAQPDMILTAQHIGEIIRKAGTFLGINRVKDAFPQYKRGTWLRKLMKLLLDTLAARLEGPGTILAAIRALRGQDTIPIMTTHKSKGLEFHTVVFMGLEDGAFWTYQNQSVSDNNLVFVALSRAKMRVLFTFSAMRHLRNRWREQSAEVIRPIHSLIVGYPYVTVIDHTQ